MLKFSKLAPEITLDETSSDEKNKEVHELNAKHMFDKKTRMTDGKLQSINGSFSARSRGSNQGA